MQRAIALFAICAMMLAIISEPVTAGSVDGDEGMPPPISTTGGTAIPIVALDLFLKQSPLALIAFYSPQCGACAGYIPEFDRAALVYANATRSEQPDPAVGSAPEEPVAFARVDVSGGGALVERIVKRFRVTKFPSVRVVVNGDQVSPVEIESVAKTAEQIATAARQIGRRFQYEGAALTSVADVRKLIDERIKKDVDGASAGRTLVIARFDATDRPGGDSKTGAVTACRSAFSAAMVALIEVPFLEVHVTFSKAVVEDAAGDAPHDIALPGWNVHPDEAAECSAESSVAFVKCGSVYAGECRVAAAHLPMPASAEQLLRLIATHALPPVTDYEPSVKTLIEKAWMDTSVPLVAPNTAVGSGVPANRRGRREIVSTARYDELRSARRTRPVLIYFTQVKNCGENTTEARTLRYLRRTLRQVAFEHPNITFVVADSYEYNTLFLRFGFKRAHARDNIVFGIIDGGQRFSSLPMNFSAGYSADKVREFVTAFNNDRVPRHWKSSRRNGLDDVLGSTRRPPTLFSTDGKTRADGLRIVSSKDLERSLFRLDAPPTAQDRRLLGGREDVALVLFAHKHCHNCRALMQRFARLADAQRELVALMDDLEGTGNGEHGGVNDADVPSMFLSQPDPSVAFDADDNEDRASAETEINNADAARDEGYDVNVEALDEEAAADKLREFTVEASRKAGVLTPMAKALRRLSFFAVNASENDTPSEQWMPDPQLNVFPVVAAVHRTSRIAYDTDRVNGAWDVTVRSPVLMDLLTKRFGDSGPRELRLLEFADKEMRAGERLGQRFVRGG